MVTPLARASASSFSILGMEATQRGRPSVLQNCLMKSIIKSAVVLGSAVTGLSSGAGGVFTLDHSSMMVWAGAGAPSDNRWRNRNMFFLPRFVAPRGPASARAVKREEKRSIRVHALQQTTSLFDHLVGELLKMHRHVEAERLGGLRIDRHLELMTPNARADCGCAYAASGHAAALPIR